MEDFERVQEALSKIDFEGVPFVIAILNSESNVRIAHNISNRQAILMLTRSIATLSEV